MASDRNYRTMFQFEMMRWLLIGATIGVILLVSLYITAVSNFWFGLVGFGGAAVVLFMYFSIHTFSANPATKWIPQVMGVYVNRLKGWGPALLPWTGPLTINATPMPGGIMHKDLDPKEMIPDDRVTVVIPTHMIYEVDDENPVQVILLGGIEKAADLLQEYLEKLIRLWITHPDKGPQALGLGVNETKMTLDQVRGMSNEVTNHILEELAKDDIAVIHSDVPTEILIKYFGTKQQFWPREKEWVDKIEKMSATEKAQLRTEVQERMQDIEAIRNGKKPIRVQSVGLIVRRLIVGDIEADGPSAEAVAEVAQENFRAEKNMIKARNLRDQINVLKDVCDNPEEAAQVNNGTIKKTIEEKNFGLSGPVLTAIPPFVEAVLNRTPVTDRKETDNGGIGNNAGK